MRSYTSHHRGILPFAREAIGLARSYRRDSAGHVDRALAGAKEMERRLQERYAVELEGKRVLDVGAGQRLLQLTYFAARGNEVVGIDRDVIVRGWNPGAYLRMLRSNGPTRAAKTIGRKALRVDARHGAELRRRMGLRREPSLTVRQMDAATLAFPDETFDVVYSLAVFMHLDRPEQAVAELRRVLKPGGVAYLSLMPYTGPGGALDVRRLDDAAAPPPWAHLRPDRRDEIIEGAFLNRLGLRDWDELLRRELPDCELVRVPAISPEIREEAVRLHAEGELLEYSLDELLTVELLVLWQKPR